MKTLKMIALMVAVASPAAASSLSYLKCSGADPEVTCFLPVDDDQTDVGMKFVYLPQGVEMSSVGDDAKLAEEAIAKFGASNLGKDAPDQGSGGKKGHGRMVAFLIHLFKGSQAHHRLTAELVMVAKKDAKDPAKAAEKRQLEMALGKVDGELADLATVARKQDYGPYLNSDAKDLLAKAAGPASGGPAAGQAGKGPRK